jgi:acyl-coenzyme A synthetase/AMP-(fatty) acid ligase
VLDRHPAVRRSALVGVGSRGAQEPVLVVELVPPARLDGDLRAGLLAHLAAHPRTRTITTLLEHRRLPVDPRHNSKIDREALGRWAARELA